MSTELGWGHQEDLVLFCCCFKALADVGSPETLLVPEKILLQGQGLGRRIRALQRRTEASQPHPGPSEDHKARGAAAAMPSFVSGSSLLYLGHGK